jgi:hypothetical protein
LSTIVADEEVKNKKGVTIGCAYKCFLEPPFPYHYPYLYPVYMPVF